MEVVCQMPAMFVLPNRLAINQMVTQISNAHEEIWFALQILIGNVG